MAAEEYSINMIMELDKVYVINDTPIELDSNEVLVEDIRAGYYLKGNKLCSSFQRDEQLYRFTKIKDSKQLTVLTKDVNGKSMLDVGK